MPGPSDLLLAACPGTGPADPSCAPGCRHSFSHVARHPLLSSQIPHPGHFIHNPSRVLGKQTSSRCSPLGTSSWRPDMSARTVEFCSPVSTSTPRTAPALCSPPPRHWAHSDPRTPPLYPPQPGCPLLPPHLPVAPSAQNSILRRVLTPSASHSDPRLALRVLVDSSLSECDCSSHCFLFLSPPGSNSMEPSAWRTWLSTEDRVQPTKAFAE